LKHFIAFNFKQYSYYIDHYKLLQVVADMAEKGEKAWMVGRALPDWNTQQFLREIYETEDLTRLRWYVRTKALRAKLSEGEFRMITVMRKNILAACPKPGGSFRKVLDMKPKDYRKRILPDTDQELLDATVARLGLFKDETLTQPMYPVTPESVKRDLYVGVSADDGGRALYLKERNRLAPEDKYRKSITTNLGYGWRLGDFIKISQLKNPEHVRRRVIDETFYSRNGVPGLVQPVLAEQPLLPAL